MMLRRKLFFATLVLTVLSSGSVWFVFRYPSKVYHFFTFQVGKILHRGKYYPYVSFPHWLSVIDKQLLILHCKQELQGDPDNKTYLLSLAQNVDNPEEAEKLYVHILSMDPTNTRALIGLEITAMELKKFDTAIDTWHKINKLKHKFLKFQLRQIGPIRLLGIYLSAAKEEIDIEKRKIYQQEAKEMYGKLVGQYNEELLKSTGSKINIVTDLCDIYMKTGEWQKAFRVLEVNKSVFGKDFKNKRDYHLMRSGIFHENGLFKKVREETEAVLKLAEDLPETTEMEKEYKLRHVEMIKRHIESGISEDEKIWQKRKLRE